MDRTIPPLSLRSRQQLFPKGSGARVIGFGVSDDPCMIVGKFRREFPGEQAIEDFGRDCRSLLVPCVIEFLDGVARAAMGFARRGEIIWTNATFFEGRLEIG